MKNNPFSTHERNFQSLAIKIYNFLNNLSPSILNNIFHINISNSYNLGNHKEHYSKNPEIVRYVTETVSYIAPKICDKVPETIKTSSSLESFKSKVRKWKPEYDYRFCTKYLYHVGFVNIV